MPYMPVGMSGCEYVWSASSGVGNQGVDGRHGSSRSYMASERGGDAECRDAGYAEGLLPVGVLLHDHDTSGKSKSRTRHRGADAVEPT